MRGSPSGVPAVVAAAPDLPCGGEARVVREWQGGRRAGGRAGRAGGARTCLGSTCRSCLACACAAHVQPPRPCRPVPRLAHPEAVLQLGVEGLEEGGKQARPRAQRRVVAAQHEGQEGAPLGKALQGLPHQEGQEGKLELACGRGRQGRWQGTGGAAVGAAAHVAARMPRLPLPPSATHPALTQQRLLAALVPLFQDLFKHPRLVQVEGWQGWRAGSRQSRWAEEE